MKRLLTKICSYIILLIILRLNLYPVLEKNNFDFVYEPNDDSYFFLDIL